MDQRADMQGTGLPDIFRILLEVSQERLLSLTFQLRESPEESIVHALSLIFLHKEEQALEQLQALRDNSLAKHLAEKWHTSAGSLEDFKVKCDDFRDVAKIPRDLARIFKVLSEQRLCDPHLRDLAYQRAISALGQKTIDLNCVENVDHLMDEAKQVCGPQFAETMSLPSPGEPPGELSKNISALSLSQGKSGSSRSTPSLLRGHISTASYPTHLEISETPTTVFVGDRANPVSSSQHLHPCADKPENVATGTCTSPEVARPQSIEPDLFKAENDSKTYACGSPAASRDKMDGHTDHGLNHMRTAAATAKPVASAEEEEEEEEDEAIFYSFVILHAMEDREMAESIKEKLEPLCLGLGATFNEDFAVPGRSTLTCLEDAINNSAFTILLLTRNFNTRLFEVEVESALVNSINKRHKFNTVIPLLPQENCMSRQNMSLVLQTLIPLEENKNFERKIQKALSPVKIRAQKKVWLEERRAKDLLRREERLKQRLRMKTTPLVARDCIGASYMGSHFPNAPGSEQDGTHWWSQPSNIHIENAKYIMIGNDSQMTVELAGGDHGDN